MLSRHLIYYKKLHDSLKGAYNMRTFRFNAGLIVQVLILALLLSGCGSSYKPAQYNLPDKDIYEQSYAENGFNDTGYSSSDAASEEAPVARPSEFSQNTKIIKSAEIRLITKDYDKFTDELRKLVSSFGAYFEYESTDNDGRGRNGHFTVRVKSEKFDEFCSGTGNLAEVKSLSKNSEDIGEQYFDLESRLQTQKTKLERLHELLKRADKMEDIISLENAISDTELNIESMSGNLQRYDSLVDYSKIDLYVSEIYNSSKDPAPEISFSERMSDAFGNGFKNFTLRLQDFAVYMAYSWLSWLLVIALLIAAFFAVRAIRRKIKAKKDSAGLENKAKQKAKKDNDTSEDKTA